MATDTKKRMSLAIDADLVAWTDYAASVEGASTTGYVNRLIRQDMEAATAPMVDGYSAFMAARAARAEAVTDEARA